MQQLAAPEMWGILITLLHNVKFNCRVCKGKGKKKKKKKEEKYTYYEHTHKVKLSIGLSEKHCSSSTTVLQNLRGFNSSEIRICMKNAS